jgi:tetratricopeptide (TPR) repeat protein
LEVSHLQALSTPAAGNANRSALSQNIKGHMATRKIIAFIITVVLLLGSNSSVRADVAPPEPPSGTNPEPGNEITNVQMVSETVLIDIKANSPLDTGYGKVTATFMMRILGDTDEQMDVRFPLDQTTGWGGLCSDPLPQFSPITDLKVKVNAQSVSTKKTYQSITLPTVEEPHPVITIPCWEHFPVSFPVGKDIAIEVTYTTEPYYDADASYVYAYILETGTGWKDTIGTADVIFQLPYELNDSNFYSCQPSDCVLNGNKIQWHYEDFEPTSNISISLLPPPLWQRIDLEKKNTIKNPSDGEAWGRLAKAYKESITERRGFRSEPAALERYQLSKEAYEKAVALLPNDADWHFGFAQLLCWNAEWNNLSLDSNTEAWKACVEQIQQVLSLNPNHAGMKELIENTPELTNMIDFSGTQPDYLILTAQPSVTLNPTATTKAIPSPTVQVTKTAIPTIAVTSTLTPILTQVPKESNTFFYIGALVLLFIVGFIVMRFRKT